MSTFRLIEAEKAIHSVPKLCRLLGVSRSGYYAWRRRPLCERARFDAVLSEKIEMIHRNSRATYGAPRVHAELRSIGIRCARKRVARLMRQAKLRGCLRGRRMRTTHRLTLRQVAPDLVGRNFAAEEPDRLWVADITYVRTKEGFVATLKTELLYRNAWPTRQAARTAIFEYIEGFYNSKRRHSALGHLSPAEFEEVKLQGQDAA